MSVKACFSPIVVSRVRENTKHEVLSARMSAVPSSLVENEVAMTHLWHHLPGGKLSHFVGATATVLLALVVYASLSAQTQEGGENELRNVMNLYAEAVNKADAQLGSQVWCGSEEDSLTGSHRRPRGKTASRTHRTPLRASE
jgi:hypothetical protein